MTPEEFDELARREDYREIPRLTAMVFDTGLPEPVRRRASDVVAGFDGTVTGEQCRTWWASGDPIIKRHALRFMHRSEADIVVPVAEDDTSPLQTMALNVMGFGFDAPEFVPVIVRALTHRDPKVRETAALVLVWAEPVAAEEGLLAAAHDDVYEVAAGALDTLRFYPTQRVLREVAALREHPDEGRRAAATVTFEDLRENFESTVVSGYPKAIVRLREWMLPVHDLVPWPDEIEPRTQPHITIRHPIDARGALDAVPESTVLALIDDPEVEQGELRQTLNRIDWTCYGHETRTRLAARLVGHPNPLVREIACTPLTYWGRAADLVRLADDPDLAVRKSAIYDLGGLPADSAIAESVWRRLPTKSSTAAQEALRTYVVHAGSAATVRLVELVRSDRREGVRHEAVHNLVNLRAIEEIRSLADLLAEPPRVTWVVHSALLDGSRELGITVPVPADIAAVDNLYLQQSVRNYLARQS
ncbi:HEAT repeat domain-containing protein [Nocardia sp. CDC153]|uniref:HEAT repeat domain-containing protein n=1 Tax=Nocardia sp. CDC153 TaxID=3112167 RepID=UPI002DBC4969|nr:HEAT repeat domain-containing protein [Nocardia sp. CDC153]MEC3952664.1 HEAT repeat domain-containing protein [Nocardia sp. CDC153]